MTKDVLAHRMKHTVFRETEVERFTMHSLIKHIMLSAVYIVEKKTYIKISFSPHQGIGKSWRWHSQEWSHN